MSFGSDTPRATMPRGTREPIAIVGMSCRFPGADSLQDYWALLRDGVDAIGAVPPERFDIDAFHSTTPGAPGAVVTREGGFLSEIDRFEPLFFGISPREAVLVDPQQRLLLEVAWEALEDAGIPRPLLAGSAGGVFVGMWTNEYEDRLLASREDVDVYAATGSGRYTAAGRLSYFFDLRGPSMTVDTACSSSLVVVHLACQSLWQSESSLALAGAANLILHPFISIGYSRSGLLASDGRCKFGDARANGYVRSEGVAVVVLKRLSDAMADCDPIHGLIIGTAVNNDGYSNEMLMTPSALGHVEVLRAAYERAGVSPGRVQYVEAHGTGTRAGDPTELEALGEVLALDRAADRPFYVGSVKTNIGHTEAAAGLAGLIKVVLSLQHGEIPKSLHFEDPNPSVPWDSLPLVIPRELSPWPVHEGPAIAGVSALGITGTNAHVVVQEPAAAPRLEEARQDNLDHMLTISAHGGEALGELAERYRAFISEGAGDSSLHDICYTAGARRGHHDHRMAVVFRTPEELSDRLGSLVSGEQGPGIAHGVRRREEPLKAAFIFPGQGSQWPGMARDLLLQEPVFRRSMEACDRAIEAAASWSVLERLEDTDQDSGMDRIDVIQPVLFSIQVSLADLWRAWGIRPAAVVGHSMGEVAAAHVAGAMQLSAAARLICERSKLLKRTEGQGAMAVVELSVEDAATALEGHEERLSIAVSNSSRSTVISGEPAALDELLERLEAKEVFCRKVKVDVAAHSPQVEQLKPELVGALADLALRHETVPIYSTVTGAIIGGSELDAVYWGRNLREPVMFSAALGRMLHDGYNALVEISPHPVLLPAIEQELQHLGSAAAVVPSLRREEGRGALLESLARLYTLGAEIDWRGIYPSGRCVRLPRYAWRKEPFWCDEAPDAEGRRHASSPYRHHGKGLLGARINSSVHAGVSFWEARISQQDQEFLADHRVDGVVILPASAYISMVHEAASEAFETDSLVLEHVELHAMLPVPVEPAARLQLTLTSRSPGSATFRISSFDRGHDEGDGGWVQHVAGTVRRETVADEDDHDPLVVDVAGDGSIGPDEHYRNMDSRKLEYGPAFRGVEQLWQRDEDTIGAIRLPEAERGRDRQSLRPALLDAGLQVSLAASVRRRGTAVADTWVPVAANRIRLHRPLERAARIWARATDTPSNSDATIESDLSLVDDSGAHLVTIEGLRFRRLSRPETHDIDAWLYHTEWVKEPLGGAPPTSNPQGRAWLLLGDGRGAGNELAARFEQRGVKHLVAPPPSPEEDETGAADSGLDPASLDLIQRFLAAVDTAAERLEVVYLRALDAGDGQADDPAATAVSMCSTVVRTVQALAGSDAAPAVRISLVTGGARDPTPTADLSPPVQSVLWGLGRVVASEHPQWRCTRIDLSDSPTSTEIAALFEELCADRADDEVALRGEDRYVARLVRGERRAGDEPATGTRQRAEPLASGTEPFAIEVANAGILDGFVGRPKLRRAPAPGEVEIEVAFVGLNFMNVLSALGTCPGYPDGVGPLGIECAGRIVSVGDGVKDFSPGDEVIGVAFDCLASHAVTDARLLAHKPEGASLEEAATIPIVFTTAYQGLIQLGRLSEGERVLIHAGSGGVGLAAIQLAQHVGAEILATAGSERKRDFLRSLGVEQVMDSRSLDFAEEVMEITAGVGVDVVLNSLSGAAIERSLSCLAAYGRFVEIGKRDIYDNAMLELGPFRRNLSYCAIDLDRMGRERPELLGSLLRRVIELFAQGVLRPLPHRTFAAGKASGAFRHMALAEHIGKIVISCEDREGIAESDLESRVCLGPGSYLITGGLGGLGLAVARWMVERGATNLVLVGRSGASSAAAESVEALRRAGAEIAVVRADVADRDQMSSLAREIAASMPPLRGVVHAAGVLDDGVLLELTTEQLRRVIAPKVAGAWNLHLLTAEQPLDFFILFSSAASVLGLAGQGNYAAANAFLDGLAHYRRARGLAATSINWGPWAGVGLAAAQSNRGQRLAEQGLGSLEPADGLRSLERIMIDDPVEVAVMAVDWQRYARSNAALGNQPRFAGLLGESAREAGDEPASEVAGDGVRETLLSLEPGKERRACLEGYLCEQVSRILRLDPTRVDLHKPLKELGLDSLLGLELRNRLESGLRLSLPGTLVYNYPTISLLAPQIAHRMQIPLARDDRESAVAAGDETEVERILDEIEDLPADEVRRILAGPQALEHTDE